MTDDETPKVADAEAKEAPKKGAGRPKKDAGPEIARRKFNRGSSRRIIRAMENFENALGAFRAELDAQTFVVDPKGARVGSHPLVGDLDSFRDHARAQVNDVLAMTN